MYFFIGKVPGRRSVRFDPAAAAKSLLVEASR
jgi:hypothetical protein